jgi:hypothetical protein
LGAAGFSISLPVLLFIGRTFNNYYLLWPATGAVAAALLGVSEPAIGAANCARYARQPATPGWRR